MLIDRKTLILGAATLAAVGTGERASADPAGTAAMDGPAERVLGIGGFFFRSSDPKKLAEWYQVHLGVDPIPMDTSHHAWQQTAGSTAFAPFSEKTKYFELDHQWMINFRVRNLDAMVAQLEKADIEVKVDPDKYPNGRFARLHDPDGNPIELWEPAGSS